MASGEKMAQQGKPQNLQFKVMYAGEPDKNLRVVAYAFDSSGNLLDSEPVEGGQVQLNVPAAQARRARILFGPPLPEGRKDVRPTIDMLQRLNAYEPAWKFDPARDVQELLPIPDSLWKLWLWCSCLIRGQVLRRVSFGGILLDLPVCHARVHICEVDRLPWIILRLPDDLVFRLRDDLLRELTRPFRPPIPIPDPPPFVFDPGFIDPSPENLARSDNLRTRIGLLQRSASPLEQVALNPQPLPPRTAGLERVALNPQPLPPRTVALNPQPEPPIAAPLLSLTAATRAALTSESAGIVRQSLLSQIDLIRPYLCLWPWFWWWWYRCDEIAVLETNAQGRFETTYWYPCFGDRPDVYVWVEFFIGGVWTTVYRPRIACYTHWDYTCGSDLTIHLTDPRVPVCGDPGDSPGKSVTLMAIGENVSTHEIRMAAGSLQGLTTAGEPFGGVLEPRVQFGRTALFAAGITHYRWSYRRLTLSDGSTAASDPDFHHLDRAVIRHYAMPSGVAGVGPSYPTESMGPEFGAASVFKIQPLAPSAPGNDGWAIMVQVRIRAPCNVTYS